MPLKHNLSFVFLGDTRESVPHFVTRSRQKAQEFMWLQKIRKMSLVFVYVAAQKHCWHRGGLVIVWEPFAV